MLISCRILPEHLPYASKKLHEMLTDELIINDLTDCWVDLLYSYDRIVIEIKTNGRFYSRTLPRPWSTA